MDALETTKNLLTNLGFSDAQVEVSDQNDVVNIVVTLSQQDSGVLIGYHGEFMTDTRGTGIMNRLFHGYAPYKGTIGGRRNGVLISTANGRAVAYALWYLEERGQLMVVPGVDVYEGMIIGEHTRDNDLEVNPIKEKHLSNVRTTAKDEAIRLTPPMLMTLEKAMSYIEEDELVEITPKSIRLRKKYLNPHERKRFNRQNTE